MNRTVKQLRNKLSYEIKKLKPKHAHDRFTKAYSDRRVRADLSEDGIGRLGITSAVTDVQLADYRLTLIAQALRADGDERTLEQLRADLAVDLIIGRASVDTSVAELADGHTSDGRPCADAVRRLPASNYARPVINVTVPLQTLMGLSDHPGQLSGGSVIPSGLARMIAQRPDSTWYRMLTDEHGHQVELSTRAYQPTRPIWRDVVATHNTCYRRNCGRPATMCELDHRVPWPSGPTSTRNLAPACKADHKAKHAAGFRLDQNSDGSPVLHTPAGFSHTTELCEQPATAHWPDYRADYWPDQGLGADLDEVQHTAAEILDAISFLPSDVP